LLCFYKLFYKGYTFTKVSKHILRLRTHFCVKSTWPRPIMGSNQVFSNAGHFLLSIKLYFFVLSVLECAQIRLLVLFKEIAKQQTLDS
jgi:hypothetical protein